MDDSPAGKRIIGWIMAAVAAWGAVLAVGAWRLNHDVRRTLIVAACVAGFLGFWGVMLAVRARRIRGK